MPAIVMIVSPIRGVLHCPFCSPLGLEGGGPVLEGSSFGTVPTLDASRGSSRVMQTCQSNPRLVQIQGKGGDMVGVWASCMHVKVTQGHSLAEMFK